MSLFDPLETHETFWSFFALAPLNLAAQLFVDPGTLIEDPSSAKLAAPEAHEVLPERGNGSCGSPRAAGTYQPPALQPGVPQWLSSHFEHGDDAHRFKLYVPGGYSGQPLPMIVMLHGAQQDPDDFASGTGMNAVAESQGCIVVYPAQSEGANLFRCWNWFRPADQVRASGETAMVAALTREIMTTYNVDETRVYVAGMSAGGAMAVNLVVTHPDLYAAAAVHSGVAFGVANEPLSALCAMNDGMGKLRLPELAAGTGAPRAVPMIVFHGDADETVHPRNGDQIVAMSLLLAGEQADAPPFLSTQLEHASTGYSYTRHVFLNGKGLPVIEQWLVHGLGHAWSGGSRDGTHTDDRGPHASSEIVRFFAQFALEPDHQPG